MKNLTSNKKRNLAMAAWDGIGSALWLYNIKAYNKKEKLVNELDTSEGVKKFLHGCYKFDYVLFFIFSLICAYGAGKAIGKAFEPEPIEEDSEKSESSNEQYDFKEVTE